uniref:Uncharacterized protein n=1 Tax=Talaromyces marneffei PM1 TaxID=1077442 RepID=A0A093UXX3_TALMA
MKTEDVCSSLGTRSSQAKMLLEIQYMFSRAPVHRIPLIKDHIPNAMQTSQLWRTERVGLEPTTNCLTMMIPQDENADISITMWVGQQAGMELLKVLELQPTWSSSLGHLSP